MGRVYHTNPRNYREAFQLIKVSKTKTAGSETFNQYATVLIYGSIIQKAIQSLLESERPTTETLSVKILKPSFSVAVNDLIYKAGKVYEISNVDFDQFNQQELKLIAVFYSNLDDLPDLKKVIALNDFDNEVNTELKRAYTPLTTFKSFEKNTLFTFSETNKAIEALQTRSVEGVAGIQGIQGEMGPQGEKGEKGDQGEQGLTGKQGEQGPQGAQGPQGIAGVNGTDGINGIDGIAGEIGPKGEQGPKGDKGDIGPIGLTGIQGIQGPKGDKGDKGEQGISGPAGVQGLKGDKGEQGNTPTIPPNLIANGLNDYFNTLRATPANQWVYKPISLKDLNFFIYDRSKVSDKYLYATDTPLLVIWAYLAETKRLIKTGTPNTEAMARCRGIAKVILSSGGLPNNGIKYLSFYGMWMNKGWPKNNLQFTLKRGGAFQFINTEDDVTNAVFQYCEGFNFSNELNPYAYPKDLLKQLIIEVLQSNS